MTALLLTLTPHYLPSESIFSTVFLWNFLLLLGKVPGSSILGIALLGSSFENKIQFTEKGKDFRIRIQILATAFISHVNMGKFLFVKGDNLYLTGIKLDKICQTTFTLSSINKNSENSSSGLQKIKKTNH